MAAKSKHHFTILYVIGYVLSVFLTLAAYLVVYNHTNSKNALIAVISVLAMTQFVIQLIFFLHIGQESKPRNKLLVFWLMTTIVLILVAGSLWIMSNLNYRQTPDQINKYLNTQSQDGL